MAVKIDIDTFNSLYDRLLLITTDKTSKFPS